MINFKLDQAGFLEVHDGNGLLAILEPTSTGFTLSLRQALTANQPNNSAEQPQSITAPERIQIGLLPPPGTDLL